MSLFLRLVRATALFGVIFVSYMVQLGLTRLLGRQETTAAGREIERLPGWLKERETKLHVRNARRLLGGMLKLRGVFIKLGQVLSMTGGFLPLAYTKELESLQDQVPPHPFEDVERTFLATMGKRPDECFASIEREPIAAASLGQVHIAHLASGEKVAVKILYPQIRDIIRVDMRVLGWALSVYKRFFPFNNIERVHSSLVDLLRRETDYVHEADCMARMAANFKGEDDILFPEVIRDRSNRDILTMTFMEGFKITRLDEMKRLGIEPQKVATRLLQTFHKSLFIDRFFHADPHPGNFLVQPGPEGGDPRIVILDFGAISEVEEHLVDGAFEIMQALLMQDQDMVLRGFEKMGFVSKQGNRQLLEQTVVTYFQKLLKVKDRTPGALMRAGRGELEKLADPELERRELAELMRAIDYPEGWFYVERASVMIFWLVGQIAPDTEPLQIFMEYTMPKVLMRKFEQAAQAPALDAPADDFALPPAEPAPALQAV
jgi:predicted unusual protein kinase regulating ubiquinone biosynthesis (AarF/ABC1/UbiB family)